MDERLLDAFRSTHYLVCIDPAHWACLHVDQPLPQPLQQLVGAHAWAFITAWNPQARLHAPEHNLAAQRELLARLEAFQGAVILAAIGVGADGWYEPSLFVIGIEPSAIDALAHRYRQRGYVCGIGTDVAKLRLRSA
jgi:hypothetical protein